jgi:COP9 signalosome complex subunit 3
MALLSDIISASAHLHNSNQLPSDEYDRRIRELVEYLRQLQSTKALDSLANDKSVLDVRTFIY